MNDFSCRCELPPLKSRGFLDRWFPLPNVLFPRAAGVDISDSSVKWLSLEQTPRGFHVRAFTQVALEPGIVVEGIVRDEEKLAQAIRTLHAQARTGSYVHAALPEETGFVFTMHVVGLGSREQVLRMIEFEIEDHVPLPIDSIVYDYDVISLHSGDEGAEISVTAFPKSIVESYVQAFDRAGMKLLSLESEASSIVRSVLPAHSKDVVLIADFGRARTGIIIVNRGVPIFTSTVSVGGDAMTKVIMETMSVDADKAEEFKNEHGIARDGDKRVVEAIAGTAGALADEIARHFSYWDTRRDEHGRRVTPVARVILTGGSSNLKGLDEYVAGRVRAPAGHAHVWQNVCSFDEYIPPIDSHHALGLSTGIGLALRGI
ncbi:MAG: type IV pilus assembly protein PilM [Parcubacteria group bacterium]|nr:type IV pilus assembly protein PilM [Parcubacteria group bacterium]